MVKPSYLKLQAESKLFQKINKAWDMIKNCHLCPQKCGVDRTEGEKGICESDSRIKIASYGPHYGEEKPLVGNKGSGTIFFSNCNLQCVYCQNNEISHYGNGRIVTPERLAEIMINLQNRGCQNINLVTPTHMVYGILKSLRIACKRGLNIPLVYNTGGYESIKTLNLLEGVIDIYMPDIKYGDSKKAEKYTNAPKYFETTKKAILEMHRQVGDLKTSNEIAVEGLIIRHLVLPENISDSKKVIDFIAKEVSKNTFFNLMDQYYPSFKADQYDKLNKKIDYYKFEKLINYSQQQGLNMNMD